MNSLILILILFATNNIFAQDFKSLYKNLIIKNTSIYNIKDSTIFIRHKHKNRFKEDTSCSRKVFLLNNLNKNNLEIYNAESFFIYHSYENKLTYESVKINNFNNPIIIDYLNLDGESPHSSFFMLFKIPTLQKGDFSTKKFYKNYNIDKHKDSNIITQHYKHKNRYRKIYFYDNFKIFKLEEFNDNEEESDKYVSYEFTYFDNNCFDSICNVYNLGFHTPIPASKKTIKQKDTITKNTKKLHLLGNTSINVNPNQYYLLDYWYFGCGPCMKLMPFMHNLQNKSDTNKLKIIGVNTVDKESEILKYFKQQNYYSLQLDCNKNKPLHEINAHPTIILLDGNFNEIKRWVGYGDVHNKNIEKTLNELNLLNE